MKGQLAETGEHAKLRIVRGKANWVNRGASYKIFVDDEMVGKVRNGETKEVPVRPGHHRIRVMVTRVHGSEEWGVDLRRGELGESLSVGPHQSGLSRDSCLQGRTSICIRWRGETHSAV